MLVKRYVTATAPVMSNDVVFCPQQSKNKMYSLGGVEQSTTLVAGLSLVCFSIYGRYQITFKSLFVQFKIYFKIIGFYLNFYYFKAEGFRD